MQWLALVVRIMVQLPHDVRAPLRRWLLIEFGKIIRHYPDYYQNGSNMSMIVVCLGFAVRSICSVIPALLQCRTPRGDWPNAFPRGLLLMQGGGDRACCATSMRMMRPPFTLIATILEAKDLGDQGKMKEKDKAIEDLEDLCLS
ncbi:hypothetical protein M9H77_12817 [Catharanthus roseus]|uniref:Uncharacterized protein n=1 Tax=Catharanthus roseus TaxID=4058 RepID=A0ACC0BIL5_CATRO|nr:hypothetical protein M9H77_12817 [Catharanthus roseus]